MAWRHRLLAVLVVAAGCGRVGFGAIAVDPDGSDGEDGSSACSATGHDEDGDGIDDACDFCPHVADANADQDGDRVGDACDPNPTTPTERIAYFDPFTSARGTYTFMLVTPTYDGEHMVADTSNVVASVWLPYTPGIDVFELAGHIAGGTGAGPRQVTVGLADGAPEYYCEVYDNLSFTKLAITYTTDGVAYPQVDEFDPLPGLSDVQLVLRLYAGSSDVSCIGSWPATTMIGGPTPAGITPTVTEIGLTNVIATLDYFVQIRSGP